MGNCEQMSLCKIPYDLSPNNFSCLILFLLCLNPVPLPQNYVLFSNYAMNLSSLRTFTQGIPYALACTELLHSTGSFII